MLGVSATGLARTAAWWLVGFEVRVARRLAGAGTPQEGCPLLGTEQLLQPDIAGKGFT